MDSKELEQKIVERKIGFAETQLMTPEMLLINQWMMELDIANHKATLKWGFSRLLELAPGDGPNGEIGLRSKWIAHMDKLNSAILALEVPLVEELVKGAVRGLGALERSAVELGHVPFEPLFWEVLMDDGTVYRLVRHMDEAQAIPEAQGRPVISLEELVRVYHVRHQATFGGSSEVKGEYVASGKPMDEPLGF